MDRARRKTDKRLQDLERNMRSLYANDDSLYRASKKIVDYLENLSQQEKALYEKYLNEKDKDIKAEYKKRYMGEMTRHTLQDKTFQKLVADYSRALSDVNQKAIDLVNAEIEDTYIDNYNEVATECRKVGIRVDA